MNEHDSRYLETLSLVRTQGDDRPDRTGVGTRGLFGLTQSYNLRETFPLLTSKKMDLRAVSSELLWFIEGSGDERRLAEIRYGKHRLELDDKNTIWTANANAPYWAPKARFEGDLGRVYGVQWRKWRNSYGEVTDQLKDLIKGLQNDPHGRRHILLSWNPGELALMALPPCHMMAQFYVNSERELSCLMTQRSCDLFLGSPFNIASYSMLTMMIAQVCGLKPGDFIYSMGDAHIYQNHFDAVDEQLARAETSPASGKLWIDPAVTDIDGFKMSSFEMIDYAPLSAIKAPMAV